MTYRVLARTYRSNTFDEVVGQEVASTTLKNAIQSGRIHHGYLFTGTRGVGKTSMARILAKSLNCLASEGPTAMPCLKCESCRSIAVGEDIDVVEIDAASNTGVDNIRELRTNANLRPARSRFKIYIIDEVHMLSTPAFNALLKTLEEPPSHVKFVLATTEVHKVPATIQSRCQRFDFRAIDARAIAGHLRRILDAEKIEAEDAVLKRVARLANGSMRDALSLLDMLLSYEPSRLTGEIVNTVIPPPHDELAFAVFAALAERQAAEALGALDRALQTGRTAERFCDHLVDHARTLMLMRVCGDDTDLVDVIEADRPQLAAQARGFDAPTFVFMINLLEELRRAVKSGGAARALMDAAVVRMAMSHQFTDLEGLLARMEGEMDELPPLAEEASPKKKEHRDEARSGASNGAIAGVSQPVKSAPRATVEGSARQQPPFPDPMFRPRQTGGGGSDRTGKNPAAADSGHRSPHTDSADWESVQRDPWVQQIKEAVSGTITDVRRLKPDRVPSETESLFASDRHSGGDDSGDERGDADTETPAER